MARRSAKETMARAQQVVGLVSTVSNINWKGLNSVFQRIKDFASSVNLKDYWGRLILVTIAGVLIGFILFDWRRQAVDSMEARKDLAVAVAERDTLALQVTATDAATRERARILMELAQMDKEELDALQDILAANPDWADQPIPDAVRNGLPNTTNASR